LVVWYVCYHAWEFVAVWEFYDADGVGCLVLELFGGDVYDGVGEECALGGHLCPGEGLVVAVVAEGSGWQVDFSAVCAFACHEFAFGEELVELLNRERLRGGHCWLLL